MGQLKVVTPQTPRHEDGLRHIMDEASIPTWIATEGPALLAAGYTKLIVTAHVPSRIVGDWRAKRARRLA